MKNNKISKLCIMQIQKIIILCPIKAINYQHLIKVSIVHKYLMNTSNPIISKCKKTTPLHSNTHNLYTQSYNLSSIQVNSISQTKLIKSKTFSNKLNSPINKPNFLKSRLKLKYDLKKYNFLILFSN